MARAIWSGSISFGLVTIPVKLQRWRAGARCTSTSPTSAPARRIKAQKRVSAQDGEEVPSGTS